MAKPKKNVLAPYNKRMLTWLTKLDQAITDDILLKTHKELLSSKNDGIRLGALKLAYEVSGRLGNVQHGNIASKNNVADILEATTKLIGEIKNVVGDRNLQSNRDSSKPAKDREGSRVIKGEVVSVDEGTEE